MKLLNIFSSKKQSNHKNTVKLVRLIKNLQTNEAITTLNYAWLEKNKTLDPHSHPDGCEYYLFLKGKGQILIGKKWFKVKHGDFIKVPSSTTHSLKNKSDTPLEFTTLRTIKK